MLSLLHYIQTAKHKDKTPKKGDEKSPAVTENGQEDSQDSESATATEPDEKISATEPEVPITPVKEKDPEESDEENVTPEVTPKKRKGRPKKIRDTPAGDKDTPKAAKKNKDTPSTKKGLVLLLI